MKSGLPQPFQDMVARFLRAEFGREPLGIKNGDSS